MANDVTILVRAKDEASKVFSGIQGAAGSMAKGVALAAGGGALALAGIGIAATKMAADFESSLAEVQTLLPNLDEQGFGKLRQGVLDFSKEMGVATDQAVPALYQAISAGVPPDNVLDFMRIASKAATGGVTSLETAVDGITSVVNAYGDEVIDAQKAADIMFTAVKLGKTDFEQLSKSLFNVIPTAAAMGVSFEEVAASLALMTAQGVPTSVATTQLRAAFLELSKTGSVLDKSVQELLGGSFADLQKQGWDIGGVFAALKDRSDKAGLSFSTLFSSSEAMSAALVLAQNAGDSFGVALEAMGESAGAVDAAFSTVSETANFKLQKAMNTVKVMMIEFGSIILPHVATFLTTVVVPALDRFGDWFTEHKPQIEQAIQAIIDVSLTMWQSFKSGWEVVGPLLQRF
ncbi:MAG: phage tail tape measure protein, partial [Gemmatimonadales bacterium]|nr:phage tail tape measure protein [Gemmatimonadales bacterium]